MPVANFAPEFIALFREASRKPITIDRLTRKRAIALQFRLHSLRKEMRRESHEYLAAAERCVVRAPRTSVENPEDDEAVWALTIEPADMDFAEDLRRQGIEVSVEDFQVPDTPQDSSRRSESTSDAVRRFLNQD